MNAEQRWLRRFIPAMLVYIITLSISNRVLDSLGENPLRFAIVLIPIVPVVFGVLAFLRYLREIDELQRRIHLEGFGFSFAVTGLITFTLGFLEGVGIPPVSIIFAFPMMIVLWGVGVFIAGRRYR